MPLIATCKKCTAPFVVDEAEHDGSRAARPAPSRCEFCRREALERAVAKSREWVKSTVVIAVVFFVWAGVSLQKLKRHDDLEWAGQLGVSVISALLAAIFYFRRLRPQLQQIRSWRAGRPDHRSNRRHASLASARGTRGPGLEKGSQGKPQAEGEHPRVARRA